MAHNGKKRGRGKNKKLNIPPPPAPDPTERTKNPVTEMCSTPFVPPNQIT